MIENIRLLLTAMMIGAFLLELVAYLDGHAGIDLALALGVGLSCAFMHLAAPRS